MGDTKIEWATKVWNPVTGCTPVSDGCKNCYARRIYERFNIEPFSKISLHPDRFEQPSRWRKPQRIFVNSMGDLFHKDVRHEWIEQVFEITRRAHHHIYMFLTKRPVAMKHHYLRWLNNSLCADVPSNIWLGVTAENQEAADDRIPVLLDTHAEKRFVSVEPMLGPVDLTRCGENGLGLSGNALAWPSMSGPSRSFGDRLDWIICGGESGRNARPMQPDWARGLRDQCQGAGVPFFFKQWGEYFPCPLDNSDDPGTPWRAYPDGPRRWGFSEALQPPETWPQVSMLRVGKKDAGCLLDGREWKEFPGAPG